MLCPPLILHHLHHAQVLIFQYIQINHHHLSCFLVYTHIIIPFSVWVIPPKYLLNAFTEQVIQNATAHHPPTNAQPVPDQGPLASFPHSSYAKHHMVLKYLLVHFGWAVRALSPPNFLCSPVYSLAGQYKEAEEPLTTAWQQLKNQCIINIILILNSKHSSVPSIGKVINSVPAKTRTKIKGDRHIIHSYCANKGTEIDSMKAIFGNRTRVKQRVNTAVWPVHALEGCGLEQKIHFGCHIHTAFSSLCISM